MRRKESIVPSIDKPGSGYCRSLVRGNFYASTKQTSLIRCWNWKGAAFQLLTLLMAFRLSVDPAATPCILPYFRVSLATVEKEPAESSN